MHNDVSKMIDAVQAGDRQAAIDPVCLSSSTLEPAIRGGPWNATATHSRSSHRHATNGVPRDTRVGFRVALSVEAVRIAQKKD